MPAPDKLTSSLEENVLTGVCWNPTLAPAVMVRLTADDFSVRSYQKIAERAYEYFERYREPARAHLADLLEADMRRGEEGAMISRALQRMEKLAPELNVSYVMAELDRFVRLRQAAMLLDRAADALETGDPDKVEEALQARTASTAFTAGRWLHDPATMTSFLDREFTDLFSCGVEALDHKKIRPARKELMCLIAPKKRGKCIAAGELVLMPDGRRKRIEDVVRDRDPEVMCLDEKLGRLVVAKVAEHWSNGQKPCKTLVTATGRTMTTTGVHLYLTQRGWIPLEDVVPGLDSVATCRSFVGLGQVGTASHEARLLGYLIADGGLTKTEGATFTKADPAIRADFEGCVRSMNDQVTWSEKQPTLGYVVSDPRWAPHGSNVRNWLVALGVMGKLSKHKTVPNVVFTWDDLAIAEFLCGLFSCDGGMSGDGRIELSSASFELAEQVKHLLTRFGINSRLRHFNTSHAGKHFLDYGRVTISGKRNVVQFIWQIGFMGKKHDQAVELLGRLDAQTEYKEHRITSWTDEFMLEQVMDVLPAGEHKTYDLAVSEHHNFIAGDMVVHNSWFLVNAGKANVLQGHSVCHITLENSEEITGMRYIQAFLAMTQHEPKSQRIQLFEKDERGEFTAFNEEFIESQGVNHENRAAIMRSLRRLKRRPRLLIKEFPSRSLTIAKLSAFLDYLDRIENFVPDLLIIDYPNLMKIDMRNYRLSLGEVFSDIRGVCQERGIAGLTVTQGNRGSNQAAVVESDMISEDWSILGTVDTALTYSRTAAEKLLGLARIKVTDARNAEDDFMVMVSQNYATGQFCLDSVLMTDTLRRQASIMTGEGSEG